MVKFSLGCRAMQFHKFSWSKKRWGEKKRSETAVAAATTAKLELKDGEKKAKRQNAIITYVLERIGAGSKWRWLLYYQFDLLDVLRKIHNKHVHVQGELRVPYHIPGRSCGCMKNTHEHVPYEPTEVLRCRRFFSSLLSNFFAFFSGRVARVGCVAALHWLTAEYSTKNCLTAKRLWEPYGNCRIYHPHFCLHQIPACRQ